MTQLCTYIYVYIPLFKNLAVLSLNWASQLVLVVTNPPANAEDRRDEGSIPGLGRSPGEGNGNPFQYSCLEHPMDKGAWWATVHNVAKSQTQLQRLSTHARVLVVAYVIFSCSLWGLVH